MKRRQHVWFVVFALLFCLTVYGVRDFLIHDGRRAARAAKAAEAARWEAAMEAAKAWDHNRPCVIALNRTAPVRASKWRFAAQPSTAILWSHVAVLDSVAQHLPECGGEASTESH